MMNNKPTNATGPTLPRVRPAKAVHLPLVCLELFACTWFTYATHAAGFAQVCLLTSGEQHQSNRRVSKDDNVRKINHTNASTSIKFENDINLPNFWYKRVLCIITSYWLETSDLYDADHAEADVKFCIFYAQYSCIAYVLLTNFSRTVGCTNRSPSHEKNISRHWSRCESKTF